MYRRLSYTLNVRDHAFQILIPLDNQFCRPRGDGRPLFRVGPVIRSTHSRESAADQQQVCGADRLVKPHQFLWLHQLPPALGDIHQKRLFKNEGRKLQLIELSALPVKMVRSIHVGAEMVEQVLIIEDIDLSGLDPDTLETVFALPLFIEGIDSGDKRYSQCHTSEGADFS